MSLNLWGVPKGLDDLLYPLGNQGTNPNKVRKRISFICLVHSLYENRNADLNLLLRASHIQNQHFLYEKECLPPAT